MGTGIFSYIFQKVQPIRLTNGLLEGKGIVSYLYVGGQGVSEFENILWRGLGYLFMVDQFSHKTRFGGSTNLVTDMATDTKREIRPNTIVFISIFLSLS